MMKKVELKNLVEYSMMKKVEKPGGVAADDCIRVILAHGGATCNAEKDDNDDEGGGVVFKEGHGSFAA